MAIDKIVIKDNDEIVKTFDFTQVVFEGLLGGSHNLTVEGWYRGELVSSDTKSVIVNAAEFDPDYDAILNYAILNDIPIPQGLQQQMDNQRIIALKNSGIWDRLDFFFNLEGDAPSAFKRICWKRLIQADVYGTPEWGVDGVRGNGFNSYIDPKYNLVSDRSNPSVISAALGVSIKELGTGAVLGAHDGGNNPVWWYPSGNSYGIYRHHATSSWFSNHRVGLNMLTKNAQSDLKHYGNEILTTTTSSVNAVKDINLQILAVQRPTTIDTYGDHRISSVFFGSYITPEEFEVLKGILG